MKRHLTPVPQDEQRPSAEADLGAQSGPHHEGADEETSVTVDVAPGSEAAFLLFGDMELDSEASSSSNRTRSDRMSSASKETIPIEALTSGLPLEDSLQMEAVRERPRSAPRSRPSPPPRTSPKSRSASRPPTDAHRPQSPDVPNLDEVMAAGAAHAASLASMTPTPEPDAPREAAPRGPRTAREEAEAILRKQHSGPFREEDLEEPGEERTESTEGTLWWWPVVQQRREDHQSEAPPMHVLRSSHRSRPEPLRTLSPDDLELAPVAEAPAAADTVDTQQGSMVLLAACAVLGVVAVLWSLT